ncbi:MAG: glycosyl hydrolase family 18 protein [Treponemataceae bacterium]|nr:glycosyl hydrolase family 18 protein [Treponemataceae bacterium]
MNKIFENLIPSTRNLLLGGLVVLLEVTCSTTGTSRMVKPLSAESSERSGLSSSPPLSPAVPVNSGATAVLQGNSSEPNPPPLVLASYVPEEKPLPPPLELLPFKEIWAYVQAGEENVFDSKWPVSDVALFSATISSTGKLKGIPSRAKLGNIPARVHLVVTELSNYALTHFCLVPDFPLRSQLIQDILAAAADFDGIHIDFEAVLSEDKEYFISFLANLKKGLGKKTLSIALPARTKKTNEAYDYEQIAAVVDKVMIMAYDEHWSGSQPGSVASIEWCDRVSSYALQTIGSSKLVMGLPFYGRAWGHINPSRAYRFSTLSKLMEEKGITQTEVRNGSNYFEYTETVQVRVFYEDHRTTHGRANLYRQKGVSHIAFWRIGQEDQEIWKYLVIQ